ncbi:hypothetical protein DPMN_098165 [Dreissena polymorpha]|uniref:Uncharacterized protein n=1 Tax=Dreissena polymorpha TaxID=45954 RepID=A0A9D4LCI4_DREPO|nr:hypothetical protein DPMN_098165 [Dreissena polymorpha]
MTMSAASSPRRLMYRIERLWLKRDLNRPVSLEAAFCYVPGPVWADQDFSPHRHTELSR